MLADSVVSGGDGNRTCEDTNRSRAEEPSYLNLCPTDYTDVEHLSSLAMFAFVRAGRLTVTGLWSTYRMPAAPNHSFPIGVSPNATARATRSPPAASSRSARSR